MSNKGSLVCECRRQAAYLWGRKHIVTPRLVDWMHGDGLQVIWLSPINQRPNFYVARIDSGIDLSNLGDERVCFVDQVLDDLYDAVEDQFGPKYWTDHNSKERYEGFPALDTEGCSWGLIGLVKRADRRTEMQIRQAIRRGLCRRKREAGE